jgi:hypothetical protein
MKIFLTLLLLSSIDLMADNLSTEDCDNCKIDISGSKKEKQLVTISDIPQDRTNKEVEMLLSTTLEKVRQYKESKNSEIEKLTAQLNKLSKEFNAYKIKKTKEIKKMKIELDKSKNHRHSRLNSSSWVEIEVEDGVDIYQLAQKYYGTQEQYQQIYVANKNLIGDDLSIEDGMSLRIPITEEFEEQPMLLNLD